jgi:uncharacterized protein
MSNSPGNPAALAVRLVSNPDQPAWARPLDGANARAAQQVADAIGPQSRLGIAFSGGVDSSVLLALAARALGPGRTLAILGVSASLASDEHLAARAVAAVIGVPLIEVVTHEGENPAYRANGPDRCFHCKDELFTRISDDVVTRYGLTAVAYGENADDILRPDRPGSQAASNHRVLRPLADAGLTKADVRAVARALELPSADKPAAPCLASRIPHFEEVTPEKLRQVEAAESALRDLGFPESRVRHHGDVARIELPVVDLSRAVGEPSRTRIQAALRGAGFRFVALDVAGIQSGAFTLPLVSVHG